MMNMETMEVKDIILNLKLISKIKQNEKMSVVDKVLKVDTRFLQPIFRWYTSDNRTDTIAFIERVVNSALEYSIDENRSSVHSYEEDVIQKELTTALQGLDHLSATYKLDNLIVSKIDILKDKILRRTKITWLTQPENQINNEQIS
jgi:hypothetical protein